MIFRLLFCCYLLSTCSLAAQADFSRKEEAELRALVDESAVFERGFTGFVLFDPESRRFLHRFQAEKYFTPASNTKILTFFSAETLLRDELPAMHYRAQGDTLQLWGTGYPLLLHPDFVGLDSLESWLRARPEEHWVLSDGHFRDEHFGEGWSWDDYPYGYQLEKAALPIYGNRVQFSKSSHLAPIKLQPPYFQDRLIYQAGRTVSRLEDRNIFTFGERALRLEQLDRQVAFKYTLPLAAELLADTFGRRVTYSRDSLPVQGQYQTLRVPMSDSLYRLFLRESDNYLGEQLLLMASGVRYGHLRTADILGYMNDTLLAQLPQPLDWVDGSGLSRYNQATPESMVAVLDQLYQRIPAERLFDVFPAGGASGTIRGWYAGPRGEPFVFAKTGTLRHVHCLSGFLRSPSGKVYIFSFMHNNFPDKIKLLKEEMERVFGWLYEHLD